MSSASVSLSMSIFITSPEFSQTGPLSLCPCASLPFWLAVVRVALQERSPPQAQALQSVCDRAARETAAGTPSISPGDHSPYHRAWRDLGPPPSPFPREPEAGDTCLALRTRV